MSHDPEAVKALAAGFADGEDPDENDGFWWRSPNDFAIEVLDHLAAAGYTVTRSKYEPAAGGYVFAGNGRWMWTRGTPPNEPLYRKIEEDRCVTGRTARTP